MIGKTYLDRGEPVVVLLRWSGKGPRNVLIQRAGGDISRGLARIAAAVVAAEVSRARGEERERIAQAIEAERLPWAEPRKDLDMARQNDYRSAVNTGLEVAARLARVPAENGQPQ